jgi:hypothetical protein
MSSAGKTTFKAQGKQGSADFAPRHKRGLVANALRRWHPEAVGLLR